jgi:hypothetical protein
VHVVFTSVHVVLPVFARCFGVAACRFDIAT